MLDKISPHFLKIDKSKNGALVPVLGEISLHSIYDPQKEAKELIRGHRKTIQEKSDFLVFGLGFAYHINALSKELQNSHSENYRIVVIEPSIEIFEECTKRDLLREFSNVKIYSGMEVENLYKTKEIIDFMMLKPAVLAHPQSFNLHASYFHSFISYRASMNGFFVEEINDKDMKNYLSKFDENSNIFDVFDHIKKNKLKLTPEEALVGAFLEVCDQGSP